MSGSVPGGLDGLRFWLRRCLDEDEPRLKKFNNLKDAPGREVWEVTAYSEGRSRDMVLSLFKEADFEEINTNLPPAAAARKCYLCCVELGAHGIPTPNAVGYAEHDGMAVLLTDRVFGMSWSPSVTRVAAGLLAKLHRLEVTKLSPELRKLVALSDPREARTTGARAPEAPRQVLVHGDFFSANIIAARDGLRVVDWETFGMGDPMWDLGYLLGADSGLPEHEIEKAIEAYGAHAPVDHARLAWHRDSWRRLFAARAR